MKYHIPSILISILFLFSSHAVFSKTTAIVVSEQRLASQAGVDILRAGGNAIDAAVAVGYALAVVNPCCGNIGGGGFMLIHLANGKNIFLNFREKAPLNANKNMYLDDKGKVIENMSTKGYLAVAVPGTVLGLDTALQKYGTMSRKQVMAPAIRLAKNGFAVTEFDARLSRKFEKDFLEQPNVAAIFLKNNRPYLIGERMVQADLAKTLQMIADKGPVVFYRGAIAKAIVAASRANGGILSMEDFARYTVEFNKPVSCQYHDYTIISSPPPSSGGTTLCEMLNILEDLPLDPAGLRKADNIHFITEAMRYGFTDRNSDLGDPDFVNNPVDRLISKSYAASISKKILSAKTLPATKGTTSHRELTDTTHYSVLDKDGNAVSVTYTINGFFGARVIADHTGFFLNDEMDDFSAKSGTANNFGLVMSDTNDIQPGKRPLSSMTPTIVMKSGRLYMVLGSPGGPRIITAVLLTLLNVIDFHMTLQQAVDAPRFHYQVDPDRIDIEPDAFSSATIKALNNMGYKVNQQGTWAAVEGILIDPASNKSVGVNDRRRSAGAALHD